MFVSPGLSLVGFWGIDNLLHILLKVCPAHKDKEEIKCMGFVGGKAPIEPKFYSFLSNLRHNEQDKVDVYVFCLVLT